MALSAGPWTDRTLPWFTEKRHIAAKGLPLMPAPARLDTPRLVETEIACRKPESRAATEILNKVSTKTTT